MEALKEWAKPNEDWPFYSMMVRDDGSAPEEVFYARYKNVDAEFEERVDVSPETQHLRQDLRDIFAFTFQVCIFDDTDREVMVSRGEGGLKVFATGTPEYAAHSTWRKNLIASSLQALLQ